MNHDLTGRWSGIFNYPHTAPPTAFEADIQDACGAITGTIHEPDLYSNPPGALIAAMIDGRRQGAVLTFSKFYDSSEGYCDMVVYAGAISADGLEISGQWDIPGTWSGNFLMIRPANASGDVETSERVPTGRQDG